MQALEIMNPMLVVAIYMKTMMNNPNNNHNNHFHNNHIGKKRIHHIINHHHNKNNINHPNNNMNSLISPQALRGSLNQLRGSLNQHQSGCWFLKPNRICNIHQEQIEVSSGFDDEPQPQLNDAPNEPQPQPEPIKILVPKTEDFLVSSPSSKLITELELGISTPPVTQPQPLATLDEEFPLTARTMAVINNMDEPIGGPEPTIATPQPTQAIEDNFDDSVATWATVPKGGNDYEPIFKLRGPQFLQAIRYQFMSMEPK
ncbi:hypothetical protein PIB30_049251 [Stylosanthes scabra]|uniref:Uncharacterized protein n=1 Tax=Stylosanthes scabra TaxID=79078 RepID=A0ABU6TH22_9FABA|nr:hypothetical protein [Stylosanthes scabra]